MTRRAAATSSSPLYMGNRPIGNEKFQTDELAWDTTYHWRVDEVNDLNPDSPWRGNLWSFTTADFLIVDDMEEHPDVLEGMGLVPSQTRQIVNFINGERSVAEIRDRVCRQRLRGLRLRSRVLTFCLCAQALIARRDAPTKRGLKVVPQQSG